MGGTPARLHITVCGASRTGKTTLCEALQTVSELLQAVEGDPRQHPPHASDLILLTGLDLRVTGADAHEQQQQDQAIRAALQTAGLAWRVVYGLGPERLAQALQAVAEVAPWAWAPKAPEIRDGRWARLQAACERCGDGACEHRLFTALTGVGRG